MTIHLPPRLENPILAAVHSGRYASLDDAMTEAASMLVERQIANHDSPETTKLYARTSDLITLDEVERIAI
jgi:Arc/MetJ-type ribon-helix-helix transcriptional regulator